MVDPLKGLARGYIRRSPQTWLIVTALIAVLQGLLFLYAGMRDGVLLIPGGIGLLQNYGLWANLAGNVAFAYFARKYYAEVVSISSADVIEKTDGIRSEISKLTSMACAEGRYRYLLYIFSFIGLSFWLSNTSLHVFGFSEIHWGHQVFDSPAHPWSFVLNRINNFYTWVVLLPVCGHVFITSSIGLHRTFQAAVADGVAQYDILNPDKSGGYLFVENARLYFNIVLAVLYLDVSMHTGTFRVIHFDHMVSYAAATLLLLFGNVMVFRRISEGIGTLKNTAANSRKQKAYANDPLSFEILKYLYELRSPRVFVNFLVKAVPIAWSLAMKAAPLIPAMRLLSP